VRNVDDLVAAQKVAREMLQLHGAHALRAALIEAEIADEFDDAVAADFWRDVARAIRQIGGAFITRWC
jgi:hypothetical protein